jgi:hypothetical protein
MIAIIGNVAAQVWCNRKIVIAVIAIDLVLPYAYIRFVFHGVAIVDALWYPHMIRWLAQSAPSPMWWMVIQLHPWALTGTVAWCGLLGATAWTLVRINPRRRGLILAVFVLSNVSQCAPYLRVAFMDWLRDVRNPMWAVNLFWYGTFALVATPLSIVFGGLQLTLPRVSGRRPT